MIFKPKKGPVPVVPPSPEWDRTDGMQRMRMEPVPALRIVIVGGPRTGKTTLAAELGNDGDRGPVLHTDDLIGTHEWNDVPDAVADWMRAPGPWIIEGVQTARALRRWIRDRGEMPPIDRVIVMETPVVECTPKQSAMAKGVMKVWREVEPLLGVTVDVVYW